MKYLHEIIKPWANSSLPAIMCNGKIYTYHQLQLDVDAYSDILSKRIPPGRHVAITLGNRYETVVAMLACSQIGSPFIPLNPKIKIPKLKEILKDSPVGLTVSDIPDTFHEHEEELDSIMLANRQLPPTPDSTGLAALLYTSGSTGKPKGVMCPHSAMLAAIESINQYLRHGRTDTILTTLPLSHGYGLYQVLTGLAAGALIVLEPGFMFAQQVLKRIKETKATGFAVVPTMLTMIFKVKDWPEYLQSLEYITNAGAALPPSYMKMLIDNLPNTKVIPMHGLTECVRTLYMPPSVGKVILDSAGVPIPGVEAYVVDENLQHVSPGEVGELVICGPNVMSGYWNRPEETAKTFRKLFDKTYLFTGDLFRQDTSNYFYFVGRKDDVVKIRGERTSPKEVEDAIYELDGVEQVVVVPVYDGVDNNLVAHIVGVDLTKNIVLKWCKERLEPHMIPSNVRFWDELPKNENGKVDRKALKENSEV